MSKEKRKKGKKSKKNLDLEKQTDNLETRKIRKIKRKSSSKKPILTKDDDGNVLIKVSDNWANQAFVNQSKYKKYNLSVKENENFWKKEENV